jgi:electron transfer flavoprotein alpha subunit
MVAEIFVLAEHRQGIIRDITYEMLTKARETAQKRNIMVVSVLLGNDVDKGAEILSEYVEKLLVIEDPRLENFNSDVYQRFLTALINKYKPWLIMMGHTSYGIELAPRLAASLNIPLATDCIDFFLEGEEFFVVRQMYNGKVNARLRMRRAETYMVTVRPATFAAAKPQTQIKSMIIKEKVAVEDDLKVGKRFIGYACPPPSAVDITTAEKIVSIGRGIKDASNIPMVEELAKVLGASLACSRPIVDKGWMPSDRQVGNSGKIVKPKLYMALGISGAFQHVMGLKNSELIIAINKDPNAPIFNFSDYAVVDDLFKVVPALKNKILEAVSQSRGV